MAIVTTPDAAAGLDAWAAELRNSRREWRENVGNSSDRLLLRASIREQARYLRFARAAQRRASGGMKDTGQPRGRSMERRP
jgi:hypothetical protein